MKIFVLKCVDCGKHERLPADDCHEMPFCNVCYMPMILGEIQISDGKKSRRSIWHKVKPKETTGASGR